VLVSISVLCCLLVFLAAKNRLALYILCIVGISQVLLQSILNYGYSMPMLFLFMVCCATLVLLRQTLRGEKKFDIKNLKRGGIAVISLILCFCALISSQLLYSYLSGIFVNSPQITLPDIYNKIAGVSPESSKTGFSDYNPNYRLGQRASYDNTLILEVKADGPFYLKGRTYDTYTGTNWTVGGPFGDEYTSIYSSNGIFNFAGYAYLTNKKLNSFN
jgi:hypothetical protein